MNNLINVTSEFNQNYFPSTKQEQIIYCVFKIKPDNNIGNGKMPLDIRFVLDRSPSMTEAGGIGKQSKIDILKSAVKSVVEKLEINDSVMIVTFDSKSKIELAPTVIKTKSDKDKIKKVISDICIGDGTSMGDSLKSASSVPISNCRLTRIFAFTDGHVFDANKCRKVAKSKNNPTFLIFGTGVDYNDAFLSEIASLNGGRYEHISDMNQVDKAFDDEIKMLSNTVITNLEANIQTETDIEIQECYQLIPVITSIPIHSPNYFSAKHGDLDKVSGQILLVRFKVPPMSEGSHLIGKIRLIFDVPALHLFGQEYQMKINVEFKENINLIKKNEETFKLIQLVSANKSYQKGLQLVNSGNIEKAVTTLMNSANLYQKTGNQQLSNNIITLTNSLKTQGKITREQEDVKRTLSTVTRKTISSGQ